jgi:hypothetical protein
VQQWPGRGRGKALVGLEALKLNGGVAYGLSEDIAGGRVGW